jgi:prepilin-type N-terminal cleavage/methylation domain-containing protein
MLQNLKKRTEGFTIVEVMIVLAIAGLIILIVFLAVPALQRNSRNNARNQDAARVAAAVTECLANRNGVVASCDSAAEITYGTLSRIDTVSFGAAAFSQTDARIVYGNQCNAAGDNVVVGGGARAFAVTYQLEPAINRCVAS